MINSLSKYFIKKGPAYLVERLAKIASDVGAGFEMEPNKFKWKPRKEQKISLLDIKILGIHTKIILFIVIILLLLIFALNRPELFLEAVVVYFYKNFGILIN